MPQSFINTLIQNEATLIHCCSESKKVGDAKTINLGPIERLKKAITGDDVISCSTVKPGDTIARNFTGPMGIILSPKVPYSITHASAKDAGSSPALREQTRTNGDACTPEALSDAITSRDTNSYNEIFVHTYKVIGIFITNDVSFIRDLYILTLSDKEVYCAFPAYDFYRLDSGRFTKLVFDSTHNVFTSTRQCTVRELYA